jgi:RNase P subunit RPR2
MNEQTEGYLRHLWNLAYTSSLIGKGADAQELSVNGYTISRELIHSSFNKLIYHLEIPTAEHVMQRICRSCGSILIPGVTVRVTIRKHLANHGPLRNHVRYSCLTCGNVSTWDGALTSTHLHLKAQKNVPIDFPIQKIPSNPPNPKNNTTMTRIEEPFKRHKPNNPLKSLLTDKKRRLSGQKKAPSTIPNFKLSDFLNSL